MACSNPHHPAPKFPPSAPAPARSSRWPGFPDCNYPESPSAARDNRKKVRYARAARWTSSPKPPDASCPRRTAPSAAIRARCPPEIHPQTAAPLISLAPGCDSTPPSVRARRFRYHCPSRNSQNRNGDSVPARANAAKHARSCRPRCNRMARPTPSSARPFPRQDDPLPAPARLPWCAPPLSIHCLHNEDNPLAPSCKNKRRARRAQAHPCLWKFSYLWKALRKMKEWTDFGGLLMHANRLAGRSAHNRIAILPVLAGVEAARHFAAHKMGERFHLRLHLRHLVAHVQNNFDAGEIHAQFERQIQNHFQPLQVLVGVQPRIALRTRRRQQSHALVQAQRLRMQLVQFRYRADHVTGFGSFPGTRCHGTSPQTVARAKISRRGSSGSSLLNSFKRLRTRSSSGFGTTSCTSTIWSPRFPGWRIEGAPFSRRRSFFPLLVPGGMRTCERPSIVGTSTFEPSDASGTVTGTTV